MRLPSSFEEIPTLTAEGVRLRAPREDDVPVIARMYTDDQVLRYLPVAPGYSTQDAETFVKRFPYAWQKLDHVAFVVADAETDVCIGEAELCDFNTHRETGEVHFLLDAPARRLRTAVAALRLICRFGFEQMQLQRIEAICDAENRAVHAVGLHVGFQYEGMARGKGPGPDGTRRDAAMAALLPGDLTP